MAPTVVPLLVETPLFQESSAKTQEGPRGKTHRQKGKGSMGKEAMGQWMEADNLGQLQ